MKEDFIHFLWKTGRFDLRDLRTTTGEALTIQEFGSHNHGAGPDFGNARLRIDGLQWAGQVEMHLRSSDWYAHAHDQDPAYDGVVLHVVLEEDRPVYRRDGTRIPCLQLRGRIPAGIGRSYWRLQHNGDWIPCQKQLAGVTPPLRNLWLERLLTERLQARADAFLSRWEQAGRDWEEAFYQRLARAMGGRVNAEAMDMLARSIPLRIVLKHKHSLLQLEALFFGQSGLMPASGEGQAPYVTRLRREYDLLARKYGLRPLPVTAWRFLRLRPGNFPTVRIAQLACLYHRSGQLFGKALAAADLRELRNMFSVSLSNYWRTHYRFGKPGVRGERRLGKTTVNSLLINAVAPALFAYGGVRCDERYRNRATDLLGRLPAERNGIVEKWRKLGFEVDSASGSQALLELKGEYCNRRRCTSCAIGCAILGNSGGGGAGPSLVQEPVALYQVGG